MHGSFYQNKDPTFGKLYTETTELFKAVSWNCK